MTYSGFNGNKAGSDVLVSLNLLKQGLKRIKDTFDVKSKRKTLSARRTSSKSVARSVHNTCICGAPDSPLKPCLRTQLPALHVIKHPSPASCTASLPHALQWAVFPSVWNATQNDGCLQERAGSV